MALAYIYACVCVHRDAGNLNHRLYSVYLFVRLTRDIKKKKQRRIK